MKILRDYVCHNCKVQGEDIRELKDLPTCPRCKKSMEILFTSCNFDSFFEGSHASEYSTHGRKFNGCTKEQLYENVSLRRRVGERLYTKKSLRGQVPDEKKYKEKFGRKK